MRHTTVALLSIFVLAGVSMKVRSDIGEGRVNHGSMDRSTVDVFPAVMVPDTERRALESSIVDEEFKLHVYFPRGYEEMDEPIPVAFLLDAEYSFGAVAYIVRRLIKDQLIPPMLLVGIAYEQPYDEYYARRERDFTPSRAHRDDFPNAGGGEDFARVLRDELIPFIDRTYCVAPSDRTIIGLSFSGLFSTFLLFKETDMFQRYVIVSPSLWWDGGILFRFEEEHRTRTQTLSAKAFFAAGEKDGPSILRDMARMEETLSDSPYLGLDHKFQLFPDETHRTVFPIAVTHGLQFVFSGDSRTR